MKISPLWQDLQLIPFQLSGQVSKNTSFWKTLKHASWILGDTQQMTNKCIF